MNRRGFLQVGAFGAGTAFAHVHLPALGNPFHPPQSRRRALVMDAMGELRAEYSREVVEGMLASGIRSITVTLCDPKPVGPEGLVAAMDGLVEYDKLIAAHPQYYRKAVSVADVDHAQRLGRMAVFYLYQNSVQFDKEVDRVDLFYKLGLRSCQLTYNDRNDVGAGCRAEGRLTTFGRTVIERMNDLGMLVDLSHANMETMLDAIAASKKPVIISHTGCRAVYEHYRNTTDANLTALANKGGLVGVCQIRPFLTRKKTDNLDAYLDHLDHAVQVAGVEHVCIGSDRDYRTIELSPEYVAQLKREEGAQVVDDDLPLFLEALNGARRMEIIRRELERRKYTARDVDRIMGGNLYRVYRDVIG